MKVKLYTYQIIGMADLKPVIKWAGGKRNIMDTLISHFPSQFENYHEPFLGGASVVMEMSKRGLLKNKQVYVSDLMEPLVNLYQVIKDNVDDLIEELNNNNYKNDKDTFLQKRARFNCIKTNVIENRIECAALFVYLNRTCFNGMYRENSKGEYNVPFGKQSNPLICNEVLLRRVHEWLNFSNVVLSHCGYETSIDKVREGDFVYMDPPYYGTFTDYNKDSFGEEEQRQLRDYYKLLCEKGCKVALSNSNTDFIKQIYSQIPCVKIVEIPVKRMINSKGVDRKNVLTELLIVNYKDEP